ncbi:MAG: hypothetical protein ACRD4O_12955 [Bryobacteraceae bacterium]
MGRQIIRFSEKPTVVELCDNPLLAQKVESGFGYPERLHRANNDNALFYLPAKAQEMLEATGATGGSEVAISKIKRGNTNEWQIALAEDEPENSYEPNGHGEAAPGRNNPTPTEIPVQARIIMRPPESQTQSQGANALAPAMAPLHRPAAQLLAGALCAAIDAAIEAQAYAAAKKAAWSFDSSDVRAMAISLYIDARKEAR